MTARCLLARLSPALVVATLAFSSAAVAAQASTVPSSAALETARYPNQDGYQQGYRDGYRDGFRAGYADGRDSCRVETGLQLHQQQLRLFPNLRTQGYADGYDSGYTTGFSRSEDRYC